MKNRPEIAPARCLLAVSGMFALLTWLSLVACGQNERAASAAAFGKARGTVEPQPNGLIVCEAEEFQPRSSQAASAGWQAKPFGENYYAATFANCFLSRKAFLGAPEQCEPSEASLRVKIATAGKYLALVRYEAAYRFETQFRVVIEQDGRKVLDRLYGARDNLKIWAFREKLKKEVGWSWGAVENIVWEGHDAFAELRPGIATITLIAQKQPAPAAKRNVDLVMLTTDVKQVQDRIEKENYLPLDGMLTQSGDVWLRVTNTGNKPLVFRGKDAAGGGNWQEHSPYWVHMRNWPKVEVKVAPGQTSQWVEVGGTMDSLNDGQWFWTGDGSYRAEFGVKDAAGQIVSRAVFSGQGDLSLAADADMRYTGRLRTLDQVLYDLLAHLKKANPAPHGKTPTRTIIYAHTFIPLDKGKHAAAAAEFRRLFGLADATADAAGGRGYIDVRDMPTSKLADYCRGLGANAKNIAVVSLGDEIGLPTPGGAVHEGFRAWLQGRGIKPSDVVPGAADWSKINYSPDPKLKDQQPGLYYWSVRYQYHFGIQAIKERTDILRRHLPNAQIGANYSPHYPQEHMFLGEVFKWASVFREDGMTLPWSEDYIWQVPIGTPQMNHINLDLFRAGLRNAPSPPLSKGGKSDRKILYYVMPHAPNNTPRMWRRLFYGALGHGMKIVNLFEFQPVHVAYTENHVDDPAMYEMVLKSFRELGLYEDIVQDGQVRPAEVGLWFSETGDIWGDSHGSFAAAKRALYTAIRHQQVPLDIVLEQDALDGTLGKYKALYLTDAHVSQAASQKIADWVKAGGQLFATAGAGMFDELNRPNKVLRDLFGVEQTALDAPAGSQITFIKQDLPFAKPIDRVRLFGTSSRGETKEMPVYCVRSRIRAARGDVRETFSDGSPAYVQRIVGKGHASYRAFLPSLSYYKPAIPLRPVDRGATEDAMIHFLPTRFDRDAASVIASASLELRRPVECSQPLVETTVIESKHGMVIPLVNWTPSPIKRLQVTLNIATPKKSITLASGAAVRVAQQDGRTVLTFDLDAADVLILR